MGTFYDKYVYTFPFTAFDAAFTFNSEKVANFEFVASSLMHDLRGTVHAKCEDMAPITARKPDLSSIFKQGATASLHFSGHTFSTFSVFEFCTSF